MDVNAVQGLEVATAFLFYIPFAAVVGELPEGRAITGAAICLGLFKLDFLGLLWSGILGSEVVLLEVDEIYLATHGLLLALDALKFGIL